MKKYVLIWLIQDYPDLGGGTEYDLFDSIEELENKVNEITKDQRVSISYCAKILDEIEVVPVEKIIRWEVKHN